MNPVIADLRGEEGVFDPAFLPSMLTRCRLDDLHLVRVDHADLDFHADQRSADPCHVFGRQRGMDLVDLMVRVLLAAGAVDRNDPRLLR